MFRAPPAYPVDLNKKGVTGTAVVEFLVTKNGDVKDARVVEATDPRFGPPAVEAILRWKFKPGLKNGRPVASLNRQEFFFNLDTDKLPRIPPPAQGADSYPQAILKVPPVYPFSLNQRGISGTAEIEFTITKEGNVTDAKVVAATHPDFGQAAIESILQWKFKPGLKDGKPVNSLARQQLAFNWQPMQSPSPALAGQDQPAELLARAPIEFPAGLPPEVTTGSVVLEFVVTEEGTVKDAEIVSSSEYLFGLAALNSIYGWKFKPAMQHGHPVASRVRQEMVFNAASTPAPADSSSKK